MVSFKEHMEYLDEVNYDLDFRDLYYYHQDIWITEDYGRYIPLLEMSTGHIVNCINFLNGGGPLMAYGLGPLWLPKLMGELKRRGRII